MYLSKFTTCMYLITAIVIFTVGVRGLPLAPDAANTTTTMAESTTTMPESTTVSSNSSDGTSIVSIITVTTIDNSSSSMQTEITTDITNTSDITAPITFISSEPISNSSSSINTSPATVGPLATTQASAFGFDGASFGGGIALGAGLLLITFIAYRCYVIRANGQQKYNAM